MKLHELKDALRNNPDLLPRFVLPDGDLIPAHAHLTEVGYSAKHSIDCGGVIGHHETVVLQMHVGTDLEHRLTSDRFARILDSSSRVVPHDNLEVEVEHDCCVVARYPVKKIAPGWESVDVMLAKNKTQCLARVRAETAEASTCCGTAGCC